MLHYHVLKPKANNDKTSSQTGCAAGTGGERSFPDTETEKLQLQSEPPF
jgi:hypothetical protein